MTEERAGQIALMALKRKMLQSGISGSLLRDLGNEAKAMGITTEEAQAFVEFLLPEVLGKILGRESVSLSYGPKKKQQY